MQEIALTIKYTIIYKYNICKWNGGKVECWKKEVRFLLISSISPLLTSSSSASLQFHYSIDSNKINWLIYRFIYCFLHRTDID